LAGPCGFVAWIVIFDKMMIINSSIVAAVAFSGVLFLDILIGSQ
jgi:hypothetical protein